MRTPRNWFLIGIFVYAVLMRITPYILYRFGYTIDPEWTIYPWNFAPMTALCIFGGAFYARRWQAFALPIAALAVSDVLIGLLTENWEFAVHPTMPFVYLCFALAVTLGLIVRRKPVLWRGLAAGFVTELVFFVVTNFGVWQFQDTYPHTLDGLVTCYIAALPFFGRSLVSTGMFCGILFSPLALKSTALLRDEAEQPVPEVELVTR